MILKSDAKFKEKLNFGFKYGVGNLVNFHPTAQTFENIFSMGSFCPKYIRFELQKYRGVTFHTLNSDAKFESALILWF